MIAAAGTDAAAQRIRSHRHAKNIIFMVADGMGLSNVTAARVFRNGPNGDRLSFETLPQVGYQSTHSRNSTVTDSAAAASAWACGAKFNNGEISCRDDDGDGLCDGERPCVTVMEVAQQRGRATGLVVTSDITHATPAVWGAHVHNRKCEYTIADQLINTTAVNVLLGGGIANNRSSCRLPHTTDDDIEALIADAQASSNYTYVTTGGDLDLAVAAGADRLLGLFRRAGKTPELFRVDATVTYPAEEPTLAEMTQAALALLADNRRGLFLVVEGSQIDWANHANNQPYQLAETLAFEESVRVVLNWVGASHKRQQETLVIVVPDHDTGGFAANGPSGTLSLAGDLVHDGWTSGGHTAQDTLVWSQGPGSEQLGGALDNTDLYHVMLRVLR